MSKTVHLDPFPDSTIFPSLASEHAWVSDWPQYWGGLVQALSCAEEGEATATCDGHRNKVGIIDH